ncbi:MAG TPA: hypothetical protein VGL88_01925 [Pseudonocardiaceae bacterium]
MAVGDQRALEGQHFVHQPAPLVATVDDDRVHAHVDAHHFEAQVGELSQALTPVLPQRGLASHDTATDQLRCHR